MRILPLLLLVAATATLSCDYLGVADGSGGGNERDAVPAAPVSGGPMARFLAGIPSVDTPALDREMALTLVAMPLACLDRPHAAPRDRSTYLDEIVAARRPGYERNRAFYGCWDWHSAVNSLWAVVRIYKEFPDLPLGGLMTEKLADHLSAAALQGEVEFFEDNAAFERPYGWAWLLELYAELRTWDHPGAAEWADNVEPLATMFSERMVAYLRRLDRPSRSGAHSNTAFALAMMLDYARTMQDVALQEAIQESSQRLFAGDLGCPTAYEPWAADFLSPCLEEAALMSAVLEPEPFVAWLEGFMPSMASREFLPLTTPIDTAAEAAATGPAASGDEVGGASPSGNEPEDAAGSADRPAGTGQIDEGATAGDPEAAPDGGEAPSGEQPGEPPGGADEALRELASRSHLIGLAFIRADAMNRIAAALPPGDARVEGYRKLAELHGSMGFEAMFDADYAGSHWIGTFALKYLLTRPHP